MDLRGSRAWVIGASSGIGAAVARALVNEGATVAISARRQSALAEVSSGRMAEVPCDVSDMQGMHDAAAQVRDALGSIDLVIIATGYWQQMHAHGFERDEFVRHIEQNVIGMANCIDAALPFLSDGGTLVGISSVAGYRGMPGAQGYGAAKAAQLNLLESLRIGLRTRGIKVITVAPGFVRTPMTASNAFPMPFIIEADEAAQHILRGLRRDKAEIVFPRPMTIAMKLARVVPQSLWPRLFRNA